MNRVMSAESASFVVKPTFPDQTWSIVHFGAIADGITLNTAAIQRAIEACSAAGGGMVVFPPGHWVTGPIVLASRVRLHADKGALISFSRNRSDYPLRFSSWEGQSAVRCQPPISGTGLTDIAITGEGIFDGNGEGWRPVKKWKMTEKNWAALCSSGGIIDPTKDIWWPDEGAMQGEYAVRELIQSGIETLSEYEQYRTYLRPVLLGLYGCTNVLLEDVTFQNSPAWNIHLLECEHVTLRGVQVRNPSYAQNGDGLDLESCRYVLVDSCTFDVGDDAICMKSGKDEQGRKRGKPVEHVTVRGCTVYHGHGGFVIGSEMSGGVRHILVDNCTFIGTDVGLRFKSTRGRGGVVEHVTIRNVRMKDIAGPAISFNLYYGDTDSAVNDAERILVTEGTPEFRDIVIEDTYCDGADRALELIGLPERPLRRITFRRVTLTARQGVKCKHAEDVSFEQTNIHVDAGEAWSFEGCRRIVRDDGVRHSSHSMPAIDVYLAGDSTMSEYDASLAPQAGWGQMIGELLNDRTIVWNKAASGRSSKSFLDEGRLALIISALRPGNVLLVQFGHNDQKPDEERRTEPFSTYQEHLRTYIESARSKGAFPVLLTPVQRRSFDETGTHLDTHGDFSVAMRQLADETGVPLVDLAASSKNLLEALGPERSKELYLWLEPGAHPNYPDGVQDDTHFSEAGAREIARLVVREIKELGLLLHNISL